eukprot:Gregarina_sp_Poly_1__8432@NODE_496_length_7929_cov_119_942508_g394_i1_p2_GENE_NODE_496_length_7929_cov_119_942508_g394_i1NODE_496_length_7929_cov_119_942508_g394_i1_p2_ORF_typecomplete_len811_score137_27zfC3HC4_2/PF13923_6/4_7e10zfRING_2/PF13639_6/7_3e10zfC3HC4/PF00097_25/1_1e08zfrbx1/PF12678_7/4_1e08zfC3HC4_3/PF13920_6/6_4e08zfANAPC11/PF12861_7/2_5e07zfANAPC11/PF12861_7/7_9e03Ubox/PF04564_15/2_5e06ProkRING_4/PF14447_6/4_1e06zfRING_5/PF14634_6/2_9e05zfRING_UBOX/PF13445_6/5e05zfC3HC4_4/PF15227_6/
MPRFRDLLFGARVSSAGEDSSPTASSDHPLYGDSPKAQSPKKLLSPPNTSQETASRRKAEHYGAKYREKPSATASTSATTEEQSPSRLTCRDRIRMSDREKATDRDRDRNRHSDRDRDKEKHLERMIPELDDGGFLAYQAERLNTPSTAPVSPTAEPSFVNLTASSFAPAISQLPPDGYRDGPLLFPDPPDQSRDTLGVSAFVEPAQDQPPPRIQNFSPPQISPQPYGAPAPSHYPHVPPSPYPQPPPSPYAQPPPSPYQPPAPYVRGGYPAPPVAYLDGYDRGAQYHQRSPPLDNPGPHGWGYGHQPTHLIMPSAGTGPINIERPTALWNKQHRAANVERPVVYAPVSPRKQVDLSRNRESTQYADTAGRIGPSADRDSMERKDTSTRLSALGAAMAQTFRQHSNNGGKQAAGAVCRLGKKLVDKMQMKIEGSTAHRPPPPTHLSQRPASIPDWDLDNRRRRKERVSEEVIYVEMLPEQRILYDVLAVIAQKMALRASSQHQLGDLTTALSHLRLAANSIDLLPSPLRTELRGLAERYMSQLTLDHVDAALLSRLQQLNGDRESECSVCLDHNTEVTTPCGHPFHRDCILDWLAKRHASCPMCRAVVSVESLRPARSLRVLDAAFSATTLLRLDGDVIQEVSSNKVTVAFKEAAQIHEQFVILRNMDENTPVPKIVVFCSIKPMLVALSHLAAAIGLGHFWLVAGADEPATRREIELFKASRRTSMLLAMPRASSSKIDLSFACSIFQLDPWRRNKNDDLSMGMVCREGQKANVRLVKFVSSNSVEAEILKNAFEDVCCDATASQIILG